MRVFAFLLIALLSADAAVAQTPLERAEKDELAFIDDDHPDLVIAMRKVRATLSDFLALARSPRRSTSAFTVKVAVREDGKAEYFWITDFAGKAGRFSGRIDNIPRIVKRVRQDEIITFAENDIVDWVYMDRGRMKGNFTGCALLKQEPKADADAFKKRFGLQCDF